MENGRMEYWNVGKKRECLNPLFQYSNFPMIFSFHHSIIPIFQMGEVKTWNR
jgi:hypothetical protein